MSDQDLIAEGRKLLEAATSAPWQNDPHAHLEQGCRCLSCHGPATVWQTSNMLACSDIEPDHRCDELGHNYADAELIAFMRNTYGQLLDELERLRGTRLVVNLYAAEQARDAARARVAELEQAPARISARLDLHRGTSTRNHSTGEYKNPIREGYDRGLTDALDLLGVDAKEKFDA